MNDVPFGNDLTRKSVRPFGGTRTVLSCVLASAFTCYACSAPPRMAAPSINNEVRGSFVLQKVPSWVSSYCQAAANKLGFAVPCPRLAPRRGTWLPCRGTDQRLAGSGCFVDREFLLEKIFPASKGYEGLPGSTPLGHMTLWAVRGEPHGKGCGGFGRIHGRTRVQGVLGTWFMCPIGPSVDSSHVVLQWMNRGITNGIGFHGLTRVNIRLVKMVAGAVKTVLPGRAVNRP